MQASQKVTRDSVVASATVHKTPRVGVVLSSYKGGGDHFGNAKFEGLAEPRAAGAELSPGQIAAMTQHAIRLGNHPNRGFRRIVSGSDSVLLLVSGYTDPVIIKTVADMLSQEATGVKVTVLSVKDIASAPSVRMPAPGVWSRRDVEYRIPKALLDCDRLITIAPLRMDNGRPSLTLDNYRMLGSLDSGTQQGNPDMAAMDLYGFHPAEYAILGGTHVLRNGSRVRHNLMLAGPIASAVDAAGAAVLNLKPDQVPLLQLADKRGFGEPNMDLVWTIGNEIEEARVKS